MAGEITKEELFAFTEAHLKTAIALEKITEHLEDSAIKQDIIIEKLTNGLVDRIVEKVDEKFKNSTIAKDINYSKFFIAAVVLIIIISNVILSAFDRRIISNSEVKKIIQQAQVQK